MASGAAKKQREEIYATAVGRQNNGYRPIERNIMKTIKKEIPTAIEISNQDKEIIAQEQNLATFNAEAIISQAVAQKVDVGTMERLLAMRKELKAEFAKEEFDKAMTKFQAECPTIEKKKQGYNYKYAPLESIVEQVKDLLAKNGFSYTFDTTEGESAIVVYCKVKHIQGHTETSQIQISKETTTKMNASQQSGAATTYGKRYAFCNAFGILTGDEDTDARPQEIEQPQYTHGGELVEKPTHKQPTEKQAKLIKDLAIQKKISQSELLKMAKGTTPSKLIEILFAYQTPEVPVIEQDEIANSIPF